MIKARLFTCRDIDGGPSAFSRRSKRGGHRVGSALGVPPWARRPRRVVFRLGRDSGWLAPSAFSWCLSRGLRSARPWRRAPWARRTSARLFSRLCSIRGCWSPSAFSRMSSARAKLASAWRYAPLILVEHGEVFRLWRDNRDGGSPTPSSWISSARASSGFCLWRLRLGPVEPGEVAPGNWSRQSGWWGPRSPFSLDVERCGPRAAALGTRLGPMKRGEGLFIAGRRLGMAMGPSAFLAEV